MKVNKIICDACGKDIDVEKGMAAFEHIEVKHKIKFQAHAEMEGEKEILKTSFDMCVTCAVKIMKLIEKIKKDTKKTKEVEK